MEKLELSKFGMGSVQSFDPMLLARMKADSHNKTVGKYTETDCRKCLNRGDLAVVREDGSIVFRECSCMPARRAIRKMEKSGLKNVIRDMTFDRFRATEPWQEHFRATAMAYAENPEGWLLICGQSGSGKTHLCTAVCRQRLLLGEEVRYMPWRDDIGALKAQSRDGAEKSKLLSELKTAPLLYIDDLFKCGRSADGTANPTSADVNIAFEIINYRYINQLPTILSTEKTPEELLDIDEATASRIIELAGANVLHISRNPERNHRLRKVRTL